MSDESAVKRVRSLSLSPVCRCCASPSSEGLVQIFSNEGISRGLPEKVARCLPILISETDDLPTTICHPCSDKLEDVRSFFECCFNSNQALVIRLREERGSSSSESPDLEAQVNMYVRHFSPLSSQIKLEPSSYLDVDISVPEEDDDEEEILPDEEEADLEEDEEYVEEEEEEEDENDDDGEEEEEDPLYISKKSSTKNKSPCCEGDFKMPESKRNRRRSRKTSMSSYDPYFDDLDVDLNSPSSFSEELKSHSGSKDKAVKRGRKPLVSLSLKTCAECGEEFQDHASNLNHWKEHHPNKETYYKCTHKGCNFQSKQTDEVNKHRLRHKDKSKVAARNLSTCSVCGKRYPPKYLQSRHMYIHKNANRNQNCPVCSKLFTNDKDLSDHVKIHGPEDLKYSHVCHYCGKRFTQRANLDAHLRVHSGFKPFSCDFCGKKFTQKGNMEEHRRTHTGEKPYVCELCGFAFARRSELQLHNRCVHTGERPYQCAYCPKNFQRRDLLRKHERIHTDTRPYACEYCAKTFTQRDKMVVHTRLHTGERPYVCEVCGKGFCESGNLKKHLRVHGKEAPKIMHQNNKGKPPPLHPSAFVPTKSDHVFHRHNFTSSNVAASPPSNHANHSGGDANSSSSSTSVGGNSGLLESCVDSRNETPPSSIHHPSILNSPLKCNNNLPQSGPPLRLPSAASSGAGNVHPASIAAAAAAMTQDLKPMDYAFPAVAAAMMQQQQQQQHQQQAQQQQQQHLQMQQQQQLHRTNLLEDQQSDSASERSVTPSFIQTHHVNQGPPHHQAPGIPHYAMHGLIQHLSDWSAVYGGHHQLSGGGHGPSGGHLGGGGSQ